MFFCVFLLLLLSLYTAWIWKGKHKECWCCWSCCCYCRRPYHHHHHHIHYHIIIIWPEVCISHRSKYKNGMNSGRWHNTMTDIPTSQFIDSASQERPVSKIHLFPIHHFTSLFFWTQPLCFKYLRLVVSFRIKLV